MISNAKYHEHENYLTHKQNTPNDIKSKTCNSWKHHKVVTSFNIFCCTVPTIPNPHFTSSVQQVFHRDSTLPPNG